MHPRRSVGPVHDGADRPCPPIRKFALRETRDQALADLPWVRRLVPAVDLREFPRERALVTARAPILDIIHRVQADRPHSAGQEAAHDDGERGNAMLSSALPGSIRRLGASFPHQPRQRGCGQGLGAGPQAGLQRRQEFR